MAADITVRAQTVPSVRRRLLPTFGLSWRILGLVDRRGDDGRAPAVPALDRALPAGLSRAADRERHAGRAGARRHARQHGDRGGQAQPAQPRPRRRRRAGRAQQAAPRPAQHPAATRHADLQPEGTRRARPDLGCAGGDDARRRLLHAHRRRIDAAAQGHGLDRGRRAADAHRDVRLHRPRAGAVDHHRAVHRRPALPRAALAGDPAACRTCRPTWWPSAARPRKPGDRPATGRPQRRDRRGRPRVPEPAARAARLAAPEVAPRRGRRGLEQDQPRPAQHPVDRASAVGPPGAAATTSARASSRRPS